MKRIFFKYALIAASILSLYFDSYIGLGMAGIGFLAYLGKYSKPVYKTPQEMEKENADYVYSNESDNDMMSDMMYSNLNYNFYHTHKND